MSDPRPLDDYEEKLLENVAKRGFQVTTVTAGEDFPLFSYSIGFPATVGQGEVIAVGLHHMTAYDVIDRIFARCRDGMALGDDLILADVLGDYPVVVKAIPVTAITRDRFNSAMWFHKRHFGTPLIRAYQLVWPCATTRLYPWDAECPEGVISSQPLIYQSSIH